MYDSHWHERSMQPIRYIITCILPTWYWYAYTCLYCHTCLLTSTWDLLMLTCQWRQQLERTASPFRPRARQWSITPTPTSLDAWRVALTHSHVKVLWQQWDSEIFRVDCCSTRDAAAMAEEHPDLHGFTVHWPVPTKCCRGSVLMFFSYVFVFGFRRSTLEFGIPWPCRSDDSDSILWPCRLAILWIEVAILT